MSYYDMALIITVEADTYDEAFDKADDIAAGLSDMQQIPASAIFLYDHDNEGQRVLYLHPESATSDNASDLDVDEQTEETT